MTHADTAKTLLIQAIQRALSGRGLTNGAPCAHIQPGPTGHEIPGRALKENESCPLLPADERDQLTQSILGRQDMATVTGPATVRAHAIARAAGKRMAEINLTTRRQHPNRTTQRPGRYDGAV